MADSAQYGTRPLGLALLGYGKMGRAIAELAPARGFEVRLKLDEYSNANGAGIHAQAFQDVDVAIDFTTPTEVVGNVRRVAALGRNLVVGTTGWFDRLDEVRAIVEEAQVGMVYAPNFSIGVQLFYRAAQAAAEAFRNFSIYSPFIVETHHQFKKDAPSGTALELKRRVAPLYAHQEIPVSSVRAGYFPGTHELGFDSEADTVVLRHTARSRQGFAEGALFAARWVAGKKGLFPFADILSEEMNHEGRSA